MKSSALYIQKIRGIRAALFACAFFCVALQTAHGAKLFSGFAGFRSDIIPKDPTYNIRFGVTGFFSSQFTFKKNIFLRTAFSLELPDLANKTLFYSGSKAFFFIDDLSLILRSTFENGINYFSVFAGNCSIERSDVFLRRYFGVQVIESRFTETRTGDSTVFSPSLFAVGAADIIRFSNRPLALAFYAYGNASIAAKTFSVNPGIRFASAYRFFYFDLTGSVRIPIHKKDSAEKKALTYVNSLYANANLTMLIGNNRSPLALFLQGGILDIPLKRDKKDTNKFSLGKNIYMLEELRSRINAFETALTFFSIPQFSAKRMLYVKEKDTLGFNLQFGVTEIEEGLQSFSIGTNATVSFPEKNFTDLLNKEKAKALFEKLPTFAASQYVKIQTPYDGELAAMIQLNITHLIDKKYAEAFKLNVGWTSKF